MSLISFEEGDIEGIDFVRIPSRINMRGPLLPKAAYAWYIPKVLSVLRQIGADIAVPYYVGTYCALAILSGFRPVVPFAVGSDLALVDGSWWRQAGLKLLLRNTPLLLAIAPHLARTAQRLRLPQLRIFCSPIGIDVEPFLRYRTAAPALGDEMRIICTRSLNPIYRIDVLIRSVAVLRATRGVRLTIAGTGPLQRELEDLTRSLDLVECVEFIGRVAYEYMPMLLGRHNVYSSLAQSDGVSSSLLEAMVAGLLPAVPRNSANESWISDGENGRLLESLHPDQIASIVGEAFDDIELRRRAFELNAGIVRMKGETAACALQFRDVLRSVVNGSD